MTSACRCFWNSGAKVVQKNGAAKICYSFATDATRLLPLCYCGATRYSIFGIRHIGTEAG